jgi:hypothetical protein
VAAYAVAVLIRSLVTTGGSDFVGNALLRLLVEEAQSSLGADGATWRCLLAADADPKVFYAAARAEKGRAYCGPESAALALTSFWQSQRMSRLSPPNRFAEALRDIVALGGDTDTNASILGGLLGAQLGEEGIPLGWRTFRPEFQEAVDLADELCNLIP